MVHAGDRVCVAIEHESMYLAPGDSLQIGPTAPCIGSGIPVDTIVTVKVMDCSETRVEIDIERAHYARVLKAGTYDAPSGP